MPTALRQAPDHLGANVFRDGGGSNDGLDGWGWWWSGSEGLGSRWVALNIGSGIREARGMTRLGAVAGSGLLMLLLCFEPSQQAASGKRQQAAGSPRRLRRCWRILRGMVLRSPMSRRDCAPKLWGDRCREPPDAERVRSHLVSRETGHDHQQDPEHDGDRPQGPPEIESHHDRDHPDQPGPEMG
jgi:hypothetical protein